MLVNAPLCLLSAHTFPFVIYLGILFSRVAVRLFFCRFPFRSTFPFFPFVTSERGKRTVDAKERKRMRARCRFGITSCRKYHDKPLRICSAVSSLYLIRYYRRQSCGEFIKIFKSFNERSGDAIRHDNNPSSSCRNIASCRIDREEK